MKSFSWTARHMSVFRCFWRFPHFLFGDIVLIGTDIIIADCIVENAWNAHQWGKRLMLIENWQEREKIPRIGRVQQQVKLLAPARLELDGIRSQMAWGYYSCGNLINLMKLQLIYCKLILNLNLHCQDFFSHYVDHLSNGISMYFGCLAVYGCIP